MSSAPGPASASGSGSGSAPTPLDIAIRRLELCTYAVQELHLELEYPEDPEHKADLLLATETLTYEVIDLLNTAKLYAWGAQQGEDE